MEILDKSRCRACGTERETPSRQRCGLPLSATLALAAALFLLPGTARGAAGGSVDFTADATRIDGFGASEAFQRAAVMHGLFGLSPEHQ